jgi:hypothetical protein
MKIHQLSVFLENKPGQMAEPCRLLARAGVNIRTLTLADTQRYGILRLIVPDWEQARSLLEEAGYVVNVTEVVAVEVEDRPGGLVNLLEVFEGSDINIEYMYAFTSGREGGAVMMFRFDKPDAAIERLRCAGLNVLAGAEVCNGFPGERS